MTSPQRAPRPTPRGVPAVAPSKRPELRVVGAPVPRSRTGMWVGLSVVLVFGALLAAAVAHSLLVSGQAHLDQVNSQVRIERELLQRERLELAVQQSPEHVTKAATALGMVPSGDQTWVSPGTAEADAGTGDGTDRTDGPATPGSETDSESELAAGTTEGTTVQP